jgi:hypothetical protein
MLTRRNFFKGFLASVAVGGLVKNGLIRSEQAIVRPTRRIFDMAENTWRWDIARAVNRWPMGWDGILSEELAKDAVLANLGGYFVPDDIADGLRRIAKTRLSIARL